MAAFSFLGEKNVNAKTTFCTSGLEVLVWSINIFTLYQYGVTTGIHLS